MNKKLIYSLFIPLLFATASFSQIPDTVWTKTFGGVSSDVGNSVIETNDGGFIIAATTNSFGAGGQDIWLIKTDENGDTLWTKTFGGTGNDRTANVVQTNDNGYAVFGTTNSYGNGGDDFLLWKTDPLGNTQWHKTYGGSTDERAKEGHQLPDANYIIVGDSVGQNSFAWIIKTFEDGTFIWGRAAGSSSYGVHHHGRAVLQTDDGGFAMSGILAYLYPPGGYVNEYAFYKISSNGSLLYYKEYGMFGGVWGAIIKKLSDGNLILGGSVKSSGPYLERPLMIKIDQSGNIIWDNIILGSQYPAILTSFEPTNDNGFIFTIYGPHISLLKCDEYGILTWEKIVGGPQYDEAYSISQISDSGYIVTGYTKSFGAGNSDVWLLKFNYPIQTNVQINFFPPVDTALVQGGCCTPEITVRNLSSTSVRDSISIEPGPITTFYYFDSTGTQINIDNYYFLVIDSLDEFEYEVWYKPKSNDIFDPIVIPFDSSFYTDNNNFDIQLVVKKNGEIIDSLTQLFHADFGLDVDDEEGFIDEFELAQNYPNPFNPSTKIKFTIPATLNEVEGSLVTLEVFDVLGNEIATLVNQEKQPGTYEVEFNATSHSGSVRNLTSGIYFYQLKAGDFTETKKMILMK